MFNRIGQTHEHYLNLVSARQKLVASNLANADTPGYQTKDINFQQEFLTLAKGAQPGVIEPEELVVRNDGNNVSVDREARLLAENALRFQFIAMLAKGQFKEMKMAIQSERGT